MKQVSLEFWAKWICPFCKTENWNHQGDSDYCDITQPDLESDFCEKCDLEVCFYSEEDL